MTALAKQMHACHRSIALDGLTNPDTAAIDSARKLIAAQDALDAHRANHGVRDIDPRGDALEEAAYLAGLHYRLAMAIAGVDATRLSEVTP